MALIHHHATLSPSKTDLMSAWLLSRPWYGGSPVSVAGSFRFDDPAGEVGMEGICSAAPCSRPSPTARRHSTAPTRISLRPWSTPSSAPAGSTTSIPLLSVILTGARGADRALADGSGVEPTHAQVCGSGAPAAAVPIAERVASYDEGPLTIVDAGVLELVVARRVGVEVVAAQTRTAEWNGPSAVVAGVRPG